jgi:hypothetical protein
MWVGGVILAFAFQVEFVSFLGLFVRFFDLFNNQLNSATIEMSPCLTETLSTEGNMLELTWPVALPRNPHQGAFKDNHGP